MNLRLPIITRESVCLFTRFFILIITFVFARQLQVQGQLYFHQTPDRPPLVWQKCLGGTKNDIANDVVLTNDGGQVIAGNSWSDDGDITGHHGSTTFSDGWVVKLYNDTLIQWQISLGGTGTDVLNKIIATSDGGFLCTGTTLSTDGDVTNNHGGSDAWVVKLNSSGQILWSKAFGGSNEDKAASAFETSDGCYIITATTKSLDGDIHTLNTGTDRNAWIIKINSGGEIIWENSIDQGGIYENRNNEAVGTIQADGNTLITGISGYDVQDTAFTYERWQWNEDETAVLVTDTVRIHTDIVVCLLYKINSGDGTIEYFTKTRGASDYNNFSMTYDGSNVFLSYRVSNLFFLTCQPVGPWTEAPNYIGYDRRAISKINPVTGFCENTYTWMTDYPQCPEWEPDGYSLYFTPGVNGIGTLPGRSWVMTGERSTSTRGGTFTYDAYIEGPDFYGTYGNAGQDFFNVVKAYPGGNEFVCAGYASPEAYLPAEVEGDVYGSHGAYDFWITKMSFDPNRITGKVFLDRNNNNLQDGDEPVFKRGMVKVKKYGTERLYGIDNNGMYEAITDTGTYSVQFISYATAHFGATTGQAVFTARGQKDTIDFAVHQIGTLTDYVATLSTTNIPRAGFPLNFIITCSNNGTDTFANRPVTFVKSEKLVLDQGVPAGATVSGDTIRWNGITLLPGDTSVLTVPLRILPPPAVIINDTLFSYVLIDSVGDQLPVNNYSFVKNTVRGSYDPNDKKENHAGTITKLEVNRGNYLTYTIRFQNTGNDTAFNVVIRDSLDQQLQSADFEMVGSSHPYSFKIENNKNVTWTFANIDLVDSLQNEPASHGYITYRIKPKTNLAIGSTIKNNAAIYFDYNLPVATNTEVTTIVRTKAIWTGEVDNDWHNRLNWNIKEVPDEETEVWIPGALLQYPVINADAICFSIKADANAEVTISSGFNLLITGK